LQTEPVTTAEELGKALRSGVSEIEISYDINASVIRLKAVGPIAWVVLGAAVAAAVVAIIVTLPAAAVSGFGAVGTAGAAASAMAVATGIVGAKVASFLVKVGVAARDAGAVSRLYKDYDVTERSGRHILVRKGKP
jgi:hypothetical protein